MNALQCVIADMAAASYGYAYVTEAEDFATLSSYWDTLVTETAVSPPLSEDEVAGCQTVYAGFNSHSICVLAPIGSGYTAFGVGCTAVGLYFTAFGSIAPNLA